MNEVYVDMRKENENVSKHFKKDLVSVEELITLIDYLTDDYDELREEYERYKKYIEDNYRQIPEGTQYGISDRDFI